MTTQTLCSRCHEREPIKERGHYLLWCQPCQDAIDAEALAPKDPEKVKADAIALFERFARNDEVF